MPTANSSPGSLVEVAVTDPESSVAVGGAKLTLALLADGEVK